MSRRAWPLYAVVAGVFWGLCFSTQGFLLAPWIELAPLLLLMGQSRPLRSVQRAAGWSPAEIGAHAMPAFSGSFYPLDVTTDVFPAGKIPTC